MKIPIYSDHMLKTMRLLANGGEITSDATLVRIPTNKGIDFITIPYSTFSALVNRGVIVREVYERDDDGDTIKDVHFILTDFGRAECERLGLVEKSTVIDLTADVPTVSAPAYPDTYIPNRIRNLLSFLMVGRVESVRPTPQPRSYAVDFAHPVSMNTVHAIDGNPLRVVYVLRNELIVEVPADWTQSTQKPKNAPISHNMEEVTLNAENAPQTPPALESAGELEQSSVDLTNEANYYTYMAMGAVEAEERAMHEMMNRDTKEYQEFTEWLSEEGLTEGESDNIETRQERDARLAVAEDIAREIYRAADAEDIEPLIEGESDDTEVRPNREILPLERFGRDHWVTLLLLETVSISEGGMLAYDDPRIQWGQSGDEDDLSGNWECLKDFQFAGMLASPEPDGSDDCPVRLSNEGLRLAALLRAWKADGKLLKDFTPDAGQADMDKRMREEAEDVRRIFAGGGIADMALNTLTEQPVGGAPSGLFEVGDRVVAIRDITRRDLTLRGDGVVVPKGTVGTVHSVYDKEDVEVSFDNSENWWVARDLVEPIDEQPNLRAAAEKLVQHFTSEQPRMVESVTPLPSIVTQIFPERDSIDPAIIAGDMVTADMPFGAWEDAPVRMPAVDARTVVIDEKYIREEILFSTEYTYLYETGTPNVWQIEMPWLPDEVTRKLEGMGLRVHGAEEDSLDGQPHSYARFSVPTPSDWSDKDDTQELPAADDTRRTIISAADWREGGYGKMTREGKCRVWRDDLLTDQQFEVEHVTQDDETGEWWLHLKGKPQPVPFGADKPCLLLVEWLDDVEADVLDSDTRPYYAPGGKPNDMLTDDAYIAWLMTECRKRGYDPRDEMNAAIAERDELKQRLTEAAMPKRYEVVMTDYDKERRSHQLIVAIKQVANIEPQEAIDFTKKLLPAVLFTTESLNTAKDAKAKLENLGAQIELRYADPDLGWEEASRAMWTRYERLQAQVNDMTRANADKHFEIKRLEKKLEDAVIGHAEAETALGRLQRELDASRAVTENAHAAAEYQHRFESMKAELDTERELRIEAQNQRDEARMLSEAQETLEWKRRADTAESILTDIRAALGMDIKGGDVVIEAQLMRAANTKWGQELDTLMQVTQRQARTLATMREAINAALKDMALINRSSLVGLLRKAINRG